MISNIVSLSENLLNSWCQMRIRSFATDVICRFVHYYVVKLYNYVELETKFKL